MLGQTSGGNSYSMVRLVFRPYTQVWIAICTSAILRASTRISPGFALLGHSSPSFGYHRRRSVDPDLPRARDRAAAVRNPLDVRCASGLSRPLDSRRRWTPWSVFQDGRCPAASAETAPRRPRPELGRGRGAEGRHRGRAPFHDGDFTYFALSLQSSFQLSLTVLVLYRTRARV